MKCIYCLETKSKNSYKKREHVIPQCFGKFSPDNMILYESVCDDCNQYFGNKIELFFGRDSLEGIERLRHGIKPRKPLKNPRRVQSKICEGEWKGVIVRERYKDQSNEIGLEKVVQAGFYNKFKFGYDYFEPKDIPSGDELQRNGYAYAYNNLAWIMATCQDKKYRNGAKAVELAKKAISLSNNIDFLDTLAAAYAEAGNFEKATTIQEEVIITHN